MSWVTAPRDVRVTAKASVRADFIAPDMSPVPTLARELDKGLAGWTEGPNPEKTWQVRAAEDAARRKAAEQLGYTTGTPLRKAPRSERRVYTSGPSAEFKLRQAAAEDRRWK